MNYVIYKLDFQWGVHFGNKDLLKTNNSFQADTLFSALCLEAAKCGTDCLKQLYNRVINGRLRISDAFPYIGDRYYLPKPMKRIQSEEEGNSAVKKAFKKLSYIPADKMTEYLRGTLNPQEESKRLEENLGQYGVKVCAAVRGLEETRPYHIQYFRFHDKCGLYLIVAYEDEEERELFEELMERLSFSGIGGERSSGFGRFDFKIGKMPEVILSRLMKTDKECMTLSISLPKDNELEPALEGAKYVLVKRSGFVESDTYSDTPKRKKDTSMFKSGSCFCKRYEGNIYDVSAGGNHPVYKYGMSLWMGVSE